MNAAESYWRLYWHPGDSQPVPVELQWFDTHDYHEENFVNDVHYETLGEAHEALSTLLSLAKKLQRNLPEYTVIQAAVPTVGLTLVNVVLVRVGDFWLAPGDDEYLIPVKHLDDQVQSYKVLARP